MNDLIVMFGMVANIAQLESYEEQKKDLNNVTLFKKLTEQNAIMINQNIQIIKQNEEIIALLQEVKKNV